MTSRVARLSTAGRGPLGFLSALAVLYLAVPLIAFAVRFATASQRGFGVPGLWSALWVSVSCATISLALMVVVGVPLAYLLARSRGALSTVVSILVQVPLALPPLMSGIILIYVIGPYTTVGRWFGGDLTNSRTGIVIAMTFVSAPFLIVAARAGFASIDQGLLDVAGTLGHTHASQFLRVAVPVASRNIRAGMLLAWLRAFGEFGAVVVVAYNPTSLPVFAYNQFSGVGLPTTLAPTAIAVGVAVAAVAVVSLRWPAARVSPVPTTVATAPQRLDTNPVSFDVSHRVGSFHLEAACPTPVTHLAVLGPSGAGKTALLRCLAGVSTSRTTSFVSGTDTLSQLPARERRVGYLAQGFSLFPHMTVWQNVRFPTRSTNELAATWLRALRVEDLASRYPSQISGGQRQRVALAQVLCSEPRVLVLDEPFSALDVPVRAELRRTLRRLQRDTGVATIVVTHDPLEAATLADDVMVLRDGRVIQSGSVSDIFTHPDSPEVGRLLGVANIEVGRVIGDGALDVASWRVLADTTGLRVDDEVTWSVNPDAVRLTSPSQSVVSASETNAVAGHIIDVVNLGTRHEIYVGIPTANELELLVYASDGSFAGIGDACTVSFDRAAVRVWRASSRADDATTSAASPT